MLSKLRASRFLSGAGVYLLANIANAAIPFALLPILTRYMSPQEYGQVAMFQTLIIALSAITGLSVHGAANRKFYDEGVTDSHIREYIAACLQILAVSALPMAVFGAGLARLPSYLWWTSSCDCRPAPKAEYSSSWHWLEFSPQ